MSEHRAETRDINFSGTPRTVSNSTGLAGTRIQKLPLSRYVDIGEEERLLELPSCPEDQVESQDTIDSRPTRSEDTLLRAARLKKERLDYLQEDARKSLPRGRQQCDALVATLELRSLHLLKDRNTPGCQSQATVCICSPDLDKDHAGSLSALNHHSSSYVVLY